MKKILFLASLVMLSMSANAQKEVGSLTFQPKVGLNIARNTDSEGTDPRIGLAAGAELEYQIKEKFSLAAGVVYSMQGMKESGEVNNVPATATVKLDYINIPIVANVYVYKGLALKFGVQPGFNVSSKVTASAAGNSATYSISPWVKTFDLAIPVGLSYETNFGLVIDARYNIGVTKVYDADYLARQYGNLDAFGDLSSRNCVAQLTIGYKLKL